jgi:hypothetical protein
MSSTNNKIILAKNIALTIGAIAILYLIGLYLWRYTPVRVHPGSIRKIVSPDIDDFRKWQCDRFYMTTEYFSAYFAKVRRLSNDEEDEYTFGACFYEATVEGRIYRIGQGGMAEIVDGSESTYYADTARKINMNP